MQTSAALCAELQSTWHREIPLAAAMGIEVVEFAADELTVRAPAAANVNLHGTAFAGSLFSICVLAGWGAVWLALRGAGISGRIVVVDSRIRYRKAVTGEIACRCRVDREAALPALAALVERGRVTLPLTCSIDCRGARAVDFTGDYAVRVRGSS
jgi:thioesterase domain-containing protein